MFLYHKWLELPINTRHAIASAFGIIRKGSVEVFENRIKSDGYLLKDIETAITKKSIQAYLGTTEEDVTVLWNYLVDKMEGRDIKIIDLSLSEKHEKVADPVIEKVEVPEKPKRGRPSKKSE